MEYTRGNDIVSALKYFYQNKYGISTEVLAECRSIPEVICAAEKLQLPQNANVDFRSGSIDAINSMGRFYKLGKQVSKPAKKGKRERSEDIPKVNTAKTTKEETRVLTEESNG